MAVMVVIVVSTEYFFEILIRFCLSSLCPSCKSLSSNILDLETFENERWPQHLLLIVLERPLSPVVALLSVLLTFPKILPPY